MSFFKKIQMLRKKKLRAEKENGLKLKNKISIIILLFCSMFFCSFGRNQVLSKNIDFEEYIDFSNLIFENEILFDFERLNNLFFDERSHLVIQDEHKTEEGDVFTDEQNYVFKNEIKEYEHIQGILSSLGKIKNYSIKTYNFEKSIYDVHVNNLYYILYNVEYENYKTIEYFWLKKDKDKIYIYRYFVCRVN